MQQRIATSKNGTQVVYDPVSSHAATHLEDTPELANLVREVISTLILDGQEVAQHFDLGRIVGTCDVVNVTDSDKIVYGMRKNREDDGLVPFVKKSARRSLPFCCGSLRVAVRWNICPFQYLDRYIWRRRRALSSVTRCQ